MGRVKINNPTVQIFGQRPEAIERDIVTRNQVRYDESTIVWGDADDLPLRILDAVNKSPVAISCLGTIETFLKGSKFSDEGLMNKVIDKDGTTLWQLHGQICQYMTLLDGFAVNFKYNPTGKITGSYITGLESLRFCQPKIEKSKKIDLLKFNPYFGTAEYMPEYTKIYSMFDLDKVKSQMQTEGNLYKGQIYYYGKTRPPYKFYTVPKYWSGDRWIYADSQLQTFLKELLDNGFFQSVLIRMVGDPNKESTNPEYQKEVTGTDGVKRTKSTKTVGQEFNDKMQSMFSGVKKTGTAMVMWALNKDQSASIESFPSSVDSELLTNTVTEVIRGITIATEVPAILANLPQQVSSLGSDGNAMQKAVEIMQARVSDRQRILENFYNQILLKNSEESTTVPVKIINYSPFSTPVDIQDKFWDFMNEEEKIDFMKQNLPNVKIIRVPTATVMPETNGQADAVVNETVKNLTGRQLQGVQRIVRKFNKDEFTFEQAKQLLKNGFGFTEEDVQAWLITREEELA